ncbi:MAG: hypothetical protein J7M25_14985 [Deltaproteobacteria bacterium]|nr:hypothetical protein [Deltaproteobacteria bacterium]
MSRKRILSLVGGGVALAVVLVLKLVVLPKLEMSQKKHTQWSDARPELRTKFHAALKPMLAVVSPQTGKVIEDCLLDRAIVFLNKSGCDYYYVKSTTSRVEADRKQDACLKKVGYPAKEVEIVMVCLKQHFPKTWGFSQSKIVKSVEQLLQSKVSDTMIRKKIAACAGKRLVALLNASTCHPINQQATKPEELVRTADYCLKQDLKLHSAFGNAVKECIATVTGKPATGKPAPAAARPGSSSSHRRRRRHHRRHRR